MANRASDVTSRTEKQAVRKTEVVPDNETGAAVSRAKISSDSPRKKGSPMRDMIRRYAPLWPLVLGLTFSRAGLIVASYGSYTSTDEGIFTDGAMLAALSILAIAFAVLHVSKRTLSKRATNQIMRACIVLEAFALVGMALLELDAAPQPLVRFGLSALCTLVASGSIFYWLRRARESSTSAAAVFVFLALIISEVEIYLCSLIPTMAGHFIAMALVLVQFPCMLWARKQKQPHNIQSPTQSNDYFGFTKTMIQSRQFLAATGVGIGFLSIVIGFLRGYPDGTAVAFEPLTRIVYGLLTIAISTTIIVLILRKHQRVLTVGIFIIMELLACLALVAYAAFPEALDIGAVFTTTLNALMVGFTWYIVIAFMSFGWRDPYYYAIGGWLVWLGSRALFRVALIVVYGISANDVLMIALLGALIVVSTQVIFTQFLTISRQTIREQDSAQEQLGAAQQSKLVKLMGLDEHDTLADVRQATMQHNAEELGKQFLLSEREIEVLSLYALGYTQKRVAEELFITQGTAHAHIKRIYAKTGLHSRQEILDYMQKYTS